MVVVVVVMVVVVVVVFVRGAQGPAGSETLWGVGPVLDPRVLES